MKKMLINTILVAIVVTMAGCAKFRGASLVPSDQKSAALVLTPESAGVLIQAIQKNVKTLASSLESVPENGSGFYQKTDSYIIGPDGKPLTDKDGNPLKITTEQVTKVNNLQNFKGIDNLTEAEYTLGGYDYVQDLPENLKQMVSGMPSVLLKLKIKGAGAVAVQGTTPANREAAAKERAAIFTGMSELAKAEGAAYAIKVEAITNGVATISTSAGNLVGTILKAQAMTTPVGLATEGVSKVVSAIVRTKDDKLVDVVAADTPNSKTASELEAGVQ